MTEATLCPFSKPIFGRWCRCEYARVSDRCAGKMVCTQAGLHRHRCVELVDELKMRARFVLGIGGTDTALTHAQTMKIRCGGLIGMQRVLALPTDRRPPAVLAVIDAIEASYGRVDAFPFNEIVQDIRAFSHRRKHVDRKGDAGD